MIIKYASALIAAILMVVFVLVAVVKLQDFALGVVVVGGIALMAWDLWGSLHEKDD